MFVLFNLDYALVDAGNTITNDMINCLLDLHINRAFTIGLVSGGSFDKVVKQVGIVWSIFDYAFLEYGAIVYRDGEQVSSKSIFESVSAKEIARVETSIKSLFDSCTLEYQGERVEYRSGLMYISYIGNKADKALRDAFIEADKKEGYINKLCKAIEDANINQSLCKPKSGRVGVAVYPKTMSKAQSLEHIVDNNILFFGDNDSICECMTNDKRVTAYPVRGYKETISLLKQLDLKRCVV